MSKAADPYYNRKSIPDEFIEHVGQTGLNPQEEAANRERKYSVTGVDVRKHDSSSKGLLAFHPQSDPYYSRKKIPDSMIHGVGETGLTKEEEYLNRERKYSVNGADLRKFSNAGKGSYAPGDDPYYTRKPVDKSQIDGVGETGMSRAEEFDTRENKASLFDISNDPFQQLTGSGHRASVSGAAAPVAAAARRRSSAVAPDAAAATAAHNHHTSGYSGSQGLETIPSRVEDNDIRPSTDVPPTIPSSTLNSGTTHHTGDTGHTIFYDRATIDTDNVAPGQRL
ncbi:hypothetical protein LTS08_002531 [Lithohypha guttulata]|uniref:Uncharacterized protein n=1 Tax=Lithohypha guttulata TaxID=1690604 RepID=A0AAN7T7W6_9EURO|nr:hypothetical protein LTR05_000735 [Lithohypha guttulata]KAK5104640.1 hypothetical protein LTS08_002531 [Lithohypha guttulata]